MRGFGSDNHSGIHPHILSAIQEANLEHAPSYGTDSWTTAVERDFNHLFGQPVEVYFVYNGTAANTAAIRACTKPWQSVLCSDVAHLLVDECGAPEFLAGVKLVSLPSQHGKINLTALKDALIRKGDQHFSQARVVSLTQPTELGTCYTVPELRDICEWAHSNGLLVHIDGARIANAVVSQQTSFQKMFSETGVDVLSFGGTKNGLPFGEAVVFLNRTLAEDFRYLRKQMGQLPSKTRFLSAAFAAYLKNDLWRNIAEHSLAQAQILAKHVQVIPQVRVTRPVQSNVVFAEIPPSWVKPLREHYFFYVWDEKTFECRWMTSFDTAPEDIAGFAKALSSLSLNSN